MPDPQKADAGGSSDDWRELALNRLLWALAGGSMAAGTLVWVGTTPSFLFLFVLIGILAGAALVTLKLSLRFRQRGAILVAVLTVLGALAATQGPFPGVVLALALAPLLASVTFKSRVGYLSAVASACCLGVPGFLFRHSIVSGRVAAVSTNVMWVQMTVGYAVFAFLIIRLTSSTVGRAEMGLLESRTALGAALEDRRARIDAEAEARSKADRLRLALEAADMGVWEWTLETDSVLWSRAPSGLLGLDPLTSKGSIDDIRNAVADEDLARVEGVLAAAVRGPLDEYYVDFRVRGAEPPRWVESRGRVERDGSGQAVLVRGTAVDITARKLSEVARTSAEERWRRMSEAAFEGICFSKDGILLDVNAQLARMLGYDEKELVGKPILECVFPEDRSLVLESIRKGGSSSYGHRALRKDGSAVPVEIRARSLDEQGLGVRLTAIRDVSERLRFEAELRKQGILAAMGSLVAGVAHEVRTPLFSLSATLDALDTGFGTPEQKSELHGLLRDQVTRLSRLMQDLLDYGRPPEIRRRPASIADPIQRAATSCERPASRGRVEVRVDVPVDLPPLMIDVDRIQQVFENLISNAIHHSPRSGSVTVTARVVGEPRKGVLCEVEDDGPGLPSEDLGRVFEPFFSKRAGGTGLGLGIAQRLVDTHGGTLIVSNRPGKGVRFSAFLPAALPEA